MIGPVTADGAFILRVSVIIPAINEATHIAEAVASAIGAGADEILVVDGGSIDDTITRAAGAKVLTGRAGRAAQQNAGAAAATGDVLVFLHADSRLASGSIEQVRQACTDDRIKWGAFRQRIDASGLLYRVVEYGNGLRVRWRGLAYGDQGIWVRRDEFQRIGGFADVPLLEDLLLSRMLLHIGHPALLVGPLTTSARRWQKHGVVRQTLRNWSILAAHARGATPAQLAERYRRHDG